MKDAAQPVQFGKKNALYLSLTQATTGGSGHYDSQKFQNTDVTICLGETNSGLPQAGLTAQTAAQRAAAGHGARNWEGLQQELAFVFTDTGEHSGHLVQAQGSQHSVLGVSQHSLPQPRT